RSVSRERRKQFAARFWSARRDVGKKMMNARPHPEPVSGTGILPVLGGQARSPVPRREARPHPDPLPQGEGTANPALGKFERPWIYPQRCEGFSLSHPMGEGRGEGLHGCSAILWFYA